MKHGVQ